jgi:hypothetical protein
VVWASALGEMRTAKNVTATAQAAIRAPAQTLFMVVSWKKCLEAILFDRISESWP